MAKLKFSDLPQFPDETSKIIRETQEKLKALTRNEEIDRVKKSIASIDTSLNVPLAELKQTINSALGAVRSYWEGTFSVLREITSTLTDALSKWELPEISEEEKERIVASSRLWGNYGWTFIPDMPAAFYETPPVDIKTANREALAYCTNANMEFLFLSLRNERVNQKDLESAIFCYHNKQYKACSLILCGLIEAKLIRLRRGKNRPVGSGAVKSIIARYEQGNELAFRDTLFCLNLFAFLETLFEKACGFINEPETINRNFVEHGMNKRNVRKMDCIQLFLALYNLLRFFEMKL